MQFLVLFLLPVDCIFSKVTGTKKKKSSIYSVVGGRQGQYQMGFVEEQIDGACPSCSSVSGILFYMSDSQPRKPPDVFLLKFCCYDRRGLLHDVTKVLCELELTIKKVKVSTTPDGRVMDLFFITDTRELLHTKKRKDDTRDYLRAVLGEAMISCEIEMVGSEITACS